MELEDIIEKLPPLEQIFGVIWIITWICAIWVYHRKRQVRAIDLLLFSQWIIATKL